MNRTLPSSSQPLLDDQFIEQMTGNIKDTEMAETSAEMMNAANANKGLVDIFIRMIKTEIDYIKATAN